ncbi:hypothetical protein F4703DRAFT_1934563 [Phycomyces blakesleeanus]
MAVHNTLSCGYASAGTGFKKENITVVIGFNFDSAAMLVLCGEASVGTGFKKENITVGITVDFEGGVKRLLVQV